ncbi:MAG: enoyl-CoA hydratase/isomerase family protein [Proteobacteria bacterium]|nr:enoyl-CoA hydratase/isomerase family protein [Pseudomonadota bacterium]
MRIDHGDVLAETRGRLGLITLNRPQALHALNDAMVDGMQAALDAFAANRDVSQVLIRSSGGKAFCAGGDIRLMHDLGKAGKQDVALDFWRREYQLNTVIKRYPKPYIALLDGIVMGGGVGVSLHGTYRLAGPNYLFAMPEVGIGFFPDVGATYALPRLEGAFGMYLAMTGARIRRDDAMMLGLATHAIRADAEAEIIAALAQGEGIETLAPRFADAPGPAPLAVERAKIDHYFGQPSLAAIFAALNEGAKNDPFAMDLLAGMAKRSPMSMALAFEQVKRGAGMTFEEAMITEFRIVSRIVHDKDFYEGVRALIIDKDNSPVWNPARIEAVDPAAIEAHFAPLAQDLTFRGGSA